MILHSGASLHGHEYSQGSRSNSLPRRSSLARSAFSSPIPRRASSTYDRSSPILHRPTASSRPASDYIPRVHEPVVRFQEPESDTMSEDGRSIANSEGSVVTAGGSKRRRRSTRTSTAFHLAHPAPTLTQKQRLLHIRPRLLLQLQRLSAESRPKPAIDVLPSTVIVPRLIKKFPRMFRGKAALGANDVMVVKSEEYCTSDDHSVETTDSDEEGLANRDLMAVICQVGKSSGGSRGLAEIVLSDGSVWLATPLPNGLYEFTTLDERGNRIKARWVRRTHRRSTVDSTDANFFKYAFSIIDPNSRRHPIMASITNYTLDIPDTYTSVSSTASKYPPTSPLRGISDEPQLNFGAEPHPQRTTHIIDENMKTLIQVTGIWVALRQGLSPYFKYDDAAALASDSSPVRRTVSVGGKRRSLTLTTDTGRTSPVGLSTPDSVHSQSTFGGRIRQKCAKGSPHSTPSPDVDQLGRPKRSVSTGSAFMQRATARRTGNLSSVVATDGEGDGIFFPTTQALNEGLATSFTIEASTQHSRSLSSTTPLSTPTKPHRRTQSVSISPSAQPKAVTNGKTTRHSITMIDGSQSPDPVEKVKTSRWKAFKDFFRRSNSTSRSG